MTKNLSAISELLEATNSLYQLHRALEILAKYGISNQTTTDICVLVTKGKVKIEQLQAEKLTHTK